jgi:hypothetical protein
VIGVCGCGRPAVTHDGVTRHLYRDVAVGICPNRVLQAILRPSQPYERVFGWLTPERPTQPGERL